MLEMFKKVVMGAVVIVGAGCAASHQDDISNESATNVTDNAQKITSVEQLTNEKQRLDNKKSRIQADMATSNMTSNMTSDDKINVSTFSVVKHIRIKVVELQDSQGLKYVGGEVSKADLGVYLAQLQHILGDEFSQYRENQAMRDHHTFHMTLVNPYEFQALAKPVTFGEDFSVTLLGLGKVDKPIEQAEKQEVADVKGITKVTSADSIIKKAINHPNTQSTYFVVAQSSEAQYFRQQLLLKPKDFHVTLGFNPQDVYGVRKDKDTLIYDFPETDSSGLDLSKIKTK